MKAIPMNEKDALWFAIGALEELAKLGGDEAADAVGELIKMVDRASPRVGFCVCHDEVMCTGCLGCQA